MPNKGSWKDPFLTITFPTKVILIMCSWILLLLHMAAVTRDLYLFLVNQKEGFLTDSLTSKLLASHVVSFYLSLMASIYTLQADDGFLTCLALTSFVLNLSICIVRLCVDYITIDYRKEKYE